MRAEIIRAQVSDDFWREKGYLTQIMKEKQMSGKNRAGIWALSMPVAVRYGLEVGDSGYDQRLDPVWSTEAASRWWQDLYEHFGDSSLADYALIYGPSRAARRASDIESLAAFQFENAFRQRKGSSPVALPESREIEMDGGFYVEDLMDCLGLSQSEQLTFRKLNPALKEAYIDTALKVTIRLPESVPALADAISLKQLMQRQETARQTAATANDQNHDDFRMTVIHRVSAGEYLGSIALKYKVKVEEIIQWNQLRSDLIYAGQNLRIYLSAPLELTENDTR